MPSTLRKSTVVRPPVMRWGISLTRQCVGDHLQDDHHFFEHAVLIPPVKEIAIAGVVVLAAHMACFH